MARLVYALAGYGRGHTSRALACAGTLRRYGHEVVFCCGGEARASLETLGERVIAVPALSPVIHGNRSNWPKMIASNARSFALGPDFVRLVADLERAGPELLIADFEPFAPATADMLGLPVVTLNHQQIVTETRYRVPARHLVSSLAARAAVRVMSPYRLHHALISSFYFPELKRPAQATLLPPLLRDEVLALKPRRGEHVLVYFNSASGLEAFAERLSRVKAPFVVYNLHDQQQTFPNVHFKRPSKTFLDDLATCRAVICTAGFNLISEALFLGKPVLAVPNRGLFEQTLNALYLEREGLGRAVFGGLPTTETLRAFVAEARPVTDAGVRPGNEALVKSFHALLRRLDRARPRAGSYRREVHPS